MKISRFNELVRDEFGAAYAAVIIQDLSLDSLQDRTAAQALSAGLDPAQIWQAICLQSSIPKERWQGRKLPAAAVSEKSNIS